MVGEIPWHGWNLYPIYSFTFSNIPLINSTYWYIMLILLVTLQAFVTLHASLIVGGVINIIILGSLMVKIKGFFLFSCFTFILLLLSHVLCFPCPWSICLQNKKWKGTVRNHDIDESISKQVLPKMEYSSSCELTTMDAHKDGADKVERILR